MPPEKHMQISQANIQVGRGPGAYPIVFCSISNWSGTIRKQVKGVSSVICAVDTNVYKLYRKQISAQLGSLSKSASLIEIPSGEKAKSMAQLKRTIDKILESGADRSSLLVAIGGGVTTDLAGLAAALCLRGIRWAAVPTTLLGMVDAAIGGKTGINTTHGKNLVGAFWPPSVVAIAPEFCLSQKPRDFADGLSEALKYYAIARRPSAKIINMLLSNYPEITGRELTELIRAATGIKARIVTADEREAGIRGYLNFGHTIGHAIERAAHYGHVSHGRAVAAGMVGALWLSQKYGCPTDRSTSTINVLALRLAAGSKISVSVAETMRYMSSDKKKLAGKTRFALLHKVGDPYLRVVENKNHIRAAIKLSLAALNGAGTGK